MTKILFFLCSVSLGLLLNAHDRNSPWHVITNSVMLDNATIREEDKVLTNIYDQTAVEHKLIIGDFVMAQLLYKRGFKYRPRLIEHIVDALCWGLSHSNEKNRFKALLHLMDRAGIVLPYTLTQSLESTTIDDEPSHFIELYSYLHELAYYYVGMVKKNSYLYNDFSSYLNLLKNILYQMDRDFTVHVIALYGLSPEKLGQRTTVYRGLSGPFTEEYIMALFECGHHAYYSGTSTLFGFSFNECFDFKKQRWQFYGTYVSCFEEYSMVFAKGITSTDRDAEISLLLEIELPANIFKICGTVSEGELIINAIEPEFIKAIYILNGYNIAKIYRNPHGSSLPHFTRGTHITPQLNNANYLNDKRNMCRQENKMALWDYHYFFRHQSALSLLLIQRNLTENFFEQWPKLPKLCSRESSGNKCRSTSLYIN